MKPLPDIDDSDAMMLRGKRSALYEARRETLEAMRDAYTVLSGADWDDMQEKLSPIKSLAQRLETILTLWDSIEQ